MYVSSEVRRRETPETTPDPSIYAAAAHGASFMAVLSEVGRTPAQNNEVAPLSESEDGKNVASTDNKIPDEATSTDPSVKKPATDETTEDAPETDTTSTSENLPVPDVVDTPLPTPPSAANASAETAPPDTLMTVITGATESGSSVAVEALAVSPGSAPVAKTDTPLLSTAPLEEIAASDAKTEAAAASVSVESASATDSSVEAGAPTFPKTLNAIIAEGALRQLSGEVDDSDAPQKEDTKLDIVAEPVASDAPQELPKAPALPQSAALEAGGVRPQATSTIPRLPMANLPGELAQQIHMMQQEGATSMRLRLVPENLGDIHVEIHGSGDRLQVRLVSANPAVRDALENQMGDLKNALQKQGLALDNATVGGETAGQNASRHSERQTGSPISYRSSSPLPEVPGVRPRSAAAAAIGSSALNILA